MVKINDFGGIWSKVHYLSRKYSENIYLKYSFLWIELVFAEIVFYD